MVFLGFISWMEGGSDRRRFAQSDATGSTAGHAFYTVRDILGLQLSDSLTLLKLRLLAAHNGFLKNSCED